jgi:recombination protein RecA
MARPKKNAGNSENNEEAIKEGLSDKEIQLQLAISALRKQFGPEIIQSGEAGASMDVQFNSTGIFSVDRALGGGLPEGRIIEVFGPESGGKTTLCLTYIANMQREGKLAAFIDVEHAFDPRWATTLGVDVNLLLISQPDNGEQALEVLEALVRTGYVHVVVLDSVAALVPKKELEGDMGDHNVGAHAKLMSQAMRKLTAVISKSHTTAIFINQIREKVGVMFGNPETTTGGRALKFFSSQRIEVRRVESVKEGDKDVGNRVKIKVVKNKVSAPGQVAEYELRFDSGIDRLSDMIEVGEKVGLIEKSGSWYTYEGKRAQGVKQLKELLRADPELEALLLSQLKES